MCRRVNGSGLLALFRLLPARPSTPVLEFVRRLAFAVPIFI